MRCKAIAAFLLTAASLALVAYSQAPAGVAPQVSGSTGHGCTNETLKGDWGATIDGTVVGPNILFRGVARAHFDGKGHFTQVDHIVGDGIPPAEEWTPGGGTYTVNPDCTGSSVVNTGSNPNPIVTHFIIVDNGWKTIGVVDGNAVIAINYRIN
jgi:hypothetical protein